MFASASIANKQAWLRHAMDELAQHSQEMVRKACEAKQLEFDGPYAAEEWLTGPVVIMRFMRLLLENLEHVQAHGSVRLGRRIERGAIGDGATRERAIVEVVPTGASELVAYRGFHCEAWFEDGISLEDVHDHQAAFYRASEPHRSAAVTLVLGAGNLASIPALDILNKMFVLGRACLLKMNPVNEYLGPIFERVFAPLIEQGFLAICYGGADVGTYLCEHALIDEVHITGSAATYERILWGEPGASAQARREANTPKLTKPITGELGNVTPIIVVPGDYTDAQLDFVARNITTMVVNNASFNCVAAKLLILPDTGLADRLMARIEHCLAEVPSRFAYYPGASQRFEELTASAPKLKTIGEATAGRLPWALIRGLDPEADHAQFNTEPFCSILNETRLKTSDPLEFLQRATRFVNARVWGTLACSLIVPERVRKDAALSAGVERCIQELRYGCVCLNHWPGVAFGLGANPWGGFPSTDPFDLQSGSGWAHNASMLDSVQKVVLRGPLVVRPMPPWFFGHKNAVAATKRLLVFERRPSLGTFAKLAWAAR